MQLPPNCPSPPLSAASRDWSCPPSTSPIGDSVSSHVPCLSSDRRRHSVERKDVLAGGGAEGRSGFLRFPRWCVEGAATYPQNTESGCRDRGGGASEAGRGSVQADSEGEGEGLVISDFDCTHTEPSASQRQHTTGGIHTHTQSTAAHVAVRTPQTEVTTTKTC